MKITKSKLKQIIKEELGQIDEAEGGTIESALKHAVAILEQVDFSNQEGLDYDSVNWKLLEKFNVIDIEGS